MDMTRLSDEEIDAFLQQVARIASANPRDLRVQGLARIAYTLALPAPVQAAPALSRIEVPVPVEVPVERIVIQERERDNPDHIHKMVLAQEAQARAEQERDLARSDYRHVSQRAGDLATALAVISRQVNAYEWSGSNPRAAVRAVSRRAPCCPACGGLDPSVFKSPVDGVPVGHHAGCVSASFLSTIRAVIARQAEEKQEKQEK